MGLEKGKLEEAYKSKAPMKSTSFHARRSSEGRYFLSGQARRKTIRETPPMGPLWCC